MWLAGSEERKRKGKVRWGSIKPGSSEKTGEIWNSKTWCDKKNKQVKNIKGNELCRKRKHHGGGTGRRG